MYKRILLSLAAISVLSQASAVTISSNSVEAYNTTSGTTVSDSFTGTSISTSVLVDATSSTNDYWSRTQVDYTGSGGLATFSNDFDHKRGGIYMELSQSYADVLVFTVAFNTTYDLSGYYNVDDVTGAGQVYLKADLYDATDATFLVRSHQRSQSTVDEQFVLGGNGGDALNVFSGSLSGTLQVGHSYELLHNVYTRAYPEGDGGATAEGNITLELTPICEVELPEQIPDGGTTAILMGLALLSLAATRSRLAA